MLRTTSYDGDAISVREALYLGTPVIATDNGMRPCGVHLIPPSNPSALHRAIEETLSAPRSLRSPKARPDERNLEAVLDLYQELIEQSQHDYSRRSVSLRVPPSRSPSVGE